jgi:hypothetical protein
MVEDGLWVPPFEEHARHFGPLQALGLTGDAWIQWAQLVAERFAVTAPDVYLNPAQLAPRPAESDWDLEARWSDYLIHRHESELFNRLGFQEVESHLDTRSGEAYFESSKAGLAQLHICIVRYATSAWLMVIPEVAMVGDGQLNGVTFAAIVGQAVDQQRDLNRPIEI